MDRGIGMDALITAGPQDIGDGAITIDTGVTATTTRETGIAVKSGLKKSIPLNVRIGRSEKSGSDLNSESVREQAI
jgi:hypothetical protein